MTVHLFRIDGEGEELAGGVPIHQLGWQCQLTGSGGRPNLHAVTSNVEGGMLPMNLIAQSLILWYLIYDDMKIPILDSHGHWMVAV